MERYKLLFSLLLLIFLHNQINGQTIQLIGFLSEQPPVPVDTVIFGFANNATMGIDTALGEIDLTNTPIDTYDLRVIQRTAEDFECLYDENTEPIYFSNSFESKINLRPIVSGSEEDNSLYFEIRIYTNNFTGGYLMLFNDYINPQIPIEQYFLGLSAHLDCQPDNNMFLGDNLFDHIPTFTVPGLSTPPTPLGSDELYTSLYFKIRPGIITNTNEIPLPSYQIYPNPADEFINITDYPEAGDIYELYNTQGQLVKKGTLLPAQTQITTVDLPTGMYVLKLFSNDKKAGANHRIILH